MNASSQDKRQQRILWECRLAKILIVAHAVLNLYYSGKNLLTFPDVGGDIVSTSLPMSVWTTFLMVALGILARIFIVFAGADWIEDHLTKKELP